MHRALTEQMHMDNLEPLSFEERLGLLIDRESTERADKRLLYRLRNARLRQQACIEDIDYRLTAAASTNVSSDNSPTVTISTATSMSSSPAPLALPKRGSPAHSLTKLP